MDTIYKIAEQHKELALLVEREELTLADVADTFDALEGELSLKAESLVAVVNGIDYHIDNIDAEIKRLQGIKKTASNKKEWLRNYLKTNMQATGITKIDCPFFKITLAKGRDIVVIESEELIPDQYVDVQVVTKPNKAEILKALKAGEDVPGARIEKSDESLRIK